VVVRCRVQAAQRSLGSGVVVGRTGSAYLALTNRHVADCGRSGELTASILGGAETEAVVAWRAPDGIDAVLLRFGSEAALEPTVQQGGPPPRVGDPVFAIGNPLGYEATYTSGVLSAMRSVTQGPHRLRVLQVQASINPGNSGGGLYDRAGRLIGLATWSTSKGLAEGLGFALATDELLRLARETAPPEVREGLPPAREGGNR
jgi:serine protease Do